ncbi:hypothetical protein PPTG_23333 [Phytophthora nicotianae INRA-310]|uniref:Uncharacterized protein n=1 Tax=Phytophthora nicotianae (strain INRA-310) TaxID=761204 RepID=W2Q0C0_PHYN3|nr:hypothetical protein PPTG_23333 [Phytophthora nicotianae INRA-310]ETN06663.1 hypothetical protein PPTG_23333 [Phytophthora nicotianae INRA-310]
MFEAVMCLKANRLFWDSKLISAALEYCNLHSNWVL